VGALRDPKQKPFDSKHTLLVFSKNRLRAGGTRAGDSFMASDSCNFTFAHYEFLLTEGLRLGYRFSDFKSHADIPKEEKLILLRHDIDLSVRNALRFARIEKELGIVATYFVRVHAHLYNPFQVDAYRILREIKEMGHEMGLHYEPGFAALFGEDAGHMILREKKIVEAVLDTTVVSAAAHLPAKSARIITEQNLAQFGLKYEAYTERFTKDLKYLSDSNGRWREGCLCQHLGRHPRICVLIHPFWWFDITPIENY
jgi:hypothetical protein